MIELEKRKEKNSTKDIWDTIDVIPLLSFLGINHLQPLIHMSKILVYLYMADKQINQFAIVYIINPSLHINKVFIEQVEKCLRATYRENTMYNIIDVMRKKDTCVISLMMFYEIK